MNYANKVIVQIIIMLIGTTAAFLWKKWQLMPVVCIVYIAADAVYSYLNKKRIRKIYGDIDKVLNGNYSVKFADYSEGELSILQNEIHKLMIKLREQAQELERDKVYLCDAMADISHQLKTPLTSINLIISILTEENISYEKRLVLAGKLSSSLGHVEWLIATLLKLSKFDADTVAFKKEKVYIDSLAEEAISRLEVVMELKEISVEKNIPQGASYIGDMQWTEEAIENIFKNCIEHTGKGGKIRITAQENVIYTEIVISDNGTGIAHEDEAHIFERFYRGKNADSSSIGIGLALASEIVHKQNGTIAVKNNNSGGAEFIIKFYKTLV